MELPDLLLVAALLSVVVAPLVREYADLRRAWGFGRLAALLTTLLVLPAFAVALTAAIPLDGTPAAQWAATVLGTVAGYSLATSAVRAAGWAGREARESA